MIILVYRGDGAHEDSPIVEPLLADDALIHRGAAEMDANAHAIYRLKMAVVFRPGIRLGQIVEATDPSTAIPYRAKAPGIQITVLEAIIEIQRCRAMQLSRIHFTLSRIQNGEYSLCTACEEEIAIRRLATD